MKLTAIEYNVSTLVKRVISGAPQRSGGEPGIHTP